MPGEAGGGGDMRLTATVHAVDRYRFALMRAKGGGEGGVCSWPFFFCPKGGGGGRGSCGIGNTLFRELFHSLPMRDPRLAWCDSRPR